MSGPKVWPETSESDEYLSIKSPLGFENKEKKDEPTRVSAVLAKRDRARSFAKEIKPLWSEISTPTGSADTTESDSSKALWIRSLCCARKQQSNATSSTVDVRITALDKG
jgi:hypothetical protein